MKSGLIAVSTAAAASLVTALAILLGGGGGSTEPAVTVNAASSTRPIAAATTEIRASGPPPILESSPAIDDVKFDPAAIYTAVAPAVVTISTEYGSGTGSFVDRGTGFFVDHEGHIVTNYHVIEYADGIRVRTLAGEVVDAELIGSDPANDLAVIRIDPSEATIAPVEFADIDEVRIGHSIATIGSPHGFHHSLSTGIISGLERKPDRSGERSQTGMIQIDASVNPGNSGGVLVNARGELIGIPSRIESPIPAWTGIAFAIPVDTLERVIGRMIDGEEIRHPRLGISIQGEIQDELTISGITDDSAAARAGLRTGDVLVRIGPYQLSDLNSLIAALEQLRSGDSAPIWLERDGRTLMRTIELEPWPSG